MVIGIVPGEVIVVSADVQNREHRSLVRTGSGARHCLRQRPAAVERAYLRRQFLRDRAASVDEYLGNLVADTPENDRRMVAIAEHHGRDVPLPPFIEIAT